MCGEECYKNLQSQWCDIDERGKSTCSTNNSDFTLNNAQLCQNKTFWQQHNKTCQYEDNKAIQQFGERCRGRVMHCIFPTYLNFKYEHYPFGGTHTCKDKSDQIHKVNTSCTAEPYIKTYCKTFCPEGVELPTSDKPKQSNDFMANKDYFIEKDGKKVWRGTLCDSLCSDASVWLSEHIDTKSGFSKKFVDPYHCQDSCAEPGYGCQACTNNSGVC